MTYATKQDMTTRYSEGEFIRLTDRTNNPPSAIDDDVMNDALADADSTINGYLQAAGLTVPLPAPPRSVVKCACVLARYNLFKDKATAQVRQDYEDQIAWLQNVAKGLVQLGDNAAPAPQVSAGSPQISAPDRTFTRDSMKGF